MDSPIDMETMNRMEVDPRMEAIVSIDTTKGNRIINVNGIAISPTTKEGYILPVANDLMDVMTRVTGKMPQVFALSQQDITPYGNDLYHLNSILQPTTATTAPVVGVARSPAAPRARRMAPTLRRRRASPLRSPSSSAPGAASSTTRSSGRTSSSSTAPWSAIRPWATRSSASPR